MVRLAVREQQMLLLMVVEVLELILYLMELLLLAVALVVVKALKMRVMGVLVVEPLAGLHLGLLEQELLVKEIMAQ
jgi:hypothetical protein